MKHYLNLVILLFISYSSLGVGGCNRIEFALYELQLTNCPDDQFQFVAANGSESWQIKKDESWINCSDFSYYLMTNKNDSRESVDFQVKTLKSKTCKAQFIFWFDPVAEKSYKERIIRNAESAFKLLFPSNNTVAGEFKVVGKKDDFKKWCEKN